MNTDTVLKDLIARVEVLEARLGAPGASALPHEWPADVLADSPEPKKRAARKSAPSRKK